MKKINVIIALIITALVASGLTFGVIKFLDNKSNDKSDNNKVEEIKGDSILKLSNDQLNEKLKYLNGTDIKSNILSALAQTIDVGTDATNLKLNQNLLTNKYTKNLIVAIVGNLKLEEKNSNTDCIGGVNTDCISGNISYYTDLDSFKNLYKKVWNEELDESTNEITNNKIVVYVQGSGMGIPMTNVKAKSITLENDTYTIKTKVGIMNQNTNEYDFNNNYEGQIKFKKNANSYNIISYVITEI